MNRQQKITSLLKRNQEEIDRLNESIRKLKEMSNKLDRLVRDDEK